MICHEWISFGDVNKWWSMQNNINCDWHQVNSAYDNKDVQLAIFDYNFNSTQHFTLLKEFSVEVTAFYISCSYFGTGKLRPIYQLDAGLQKKFKSKKDILRFAADDMFNSGGHYRFVEQLPLNGDVINGDLNFGQVAFKITYTHNFGNKTLKGKRERSTGAEEELRRVHN